MEFVFEHATMIAVIAVVVIILAILASGYVKAPPDTAFIISGFQKGQRILIGKAGIKLPFFERLDKLSLKLVAIDVKTSDAVPTADYINIQVDAAVNIKVGDEPQKLQKASQNFLNRDSEYIAKVARDRWKDASGRDGFRPPEVCGAGQRKCRTGPGCDGT